MNPTATNYVISKQGNRNLALSSNDLQFFDDYANADANALKLARDTGSPWFVHELTVKTVRRHRPHVTVESWDM